MKSLIIAALAFISVPFVSQGQEFPIDAETKKINYTEVVQVAGGDKSTLYTRAKAYGAPGRTKVEDSKEEGRYIAKGVIKSKYPASMKGFFHDGTINYTLSIISKEGKYKYTITDINHTSPRGNGGKLEGAAPECGKLILTMEGWSVIKKQAREEFPKIVKALKESMDPSAPAPTKKDDDF